jgi:hypothetical protein
LKVGVFKHPFYEIGLGQHQCFIAFCWELGAVCAFFVHVYCACFSYLVQSCDYHVFSPPVSTVSWEPEFPLDSNKSGVVGLGGNLNILFFCAMNRSCKQDNARNQ